MLFNLIFQYFNLILIIGVEGGVGGLGGREKFDRGNLLGNFFWVGGMSTFLASGGDSPHSISWENSVDAR